MGCQEQAGPKVLPAVSGLLSGTDDVLRRQDPQPTSDIPPVHRHLQRHVPHNPYKKHDLLPCKRKSHWAFSHLKKIKSLSFINLRVQISKAFTERCCRYM